jgi:hypothetical protein
MRLRITILVLLLISVPTLSASQSRAQLYVNTHVATQMVENGKTEKDRLFIFYFTYLDNGYCDVRSITFNNLACSATSASALTPNQGFWPKPEFCNKSFCGDRFVCSAQPISDKRLELTVKVPVDISGELTHRVLMSLVASSTMREPSRNTPTSQIESKRLSIRRFDRSPFISSKMWILDVPK